MRYRKWTASGDYSFGNGQADFYRDEPAAVGQACQSRLYLWIGEWFLDLEEGTPYMQGVFGKHSQQDANVTIQDRALGTQALTNIPKFESVIDPETRGFTVNMTIDTLYGPTAIQLENYANY